MTLKKEVHFLLLCGCFLVGCAHPTQDPNALSSSILFDTSSAVDSSSADEVSGDSSTHSSDSPTQGEEVVPNKHIAYIEESTGLHVVDNPESTLVYVNKKRKLPDGYEPPDLVVPNVRHRYESGHMETQMRKEAAHALEELFQGAQKDGYELMTISGYRSFERQEAIYTNQVNVNGQVYADQFSARPGTSEHQTGLTMDIRYADDSKESKLDASFGDTDTGIWVAEHAHTFGFVIRYPKNKETITGYEYEPWHIRYVGKEVAHTLFKDSLTLEEYFGYDKGIPE